MSELEEQTNSFEENEDEEGSPATPGIKPIRNGFIDNSIAGSFNGSVNEPTSPHCNEDCFLKDVDVDDEDEFEIFNHPVLSNFKLEMLEVANSTKNPANELEAEKARLKREQKKVNKKKEKLQMRQQYLETCAKALDAKAQDLEAQREDLDARSKELGDQEEIFVTQRNEFETKRAEFQHAVDEIMNYVFVLESLKLEAAIGRIKEIHF